MVLHRTQILLEPEQHQALAELARREHRSLSELVREAVDRELDRRRAEAEDREARWRKWREEVLELNERILKRRGGEKLPDSVTILNRARAARQRELMANMRVPKP